MEVQLALCWKEYLWHTSIPSVHSASSSDVPVSKGNHFWTRPGISIWPTLTEFSCAEDKRGRTGNRDWTGERGYQQTKNHFPSNILQLSSYPGFFRCKRKIILPSQEGGISIINRLYKHSRRKDLLKEAYSIINMPYVHFFYFKLPTYFYLLSFPIGYNWKELETFHCLIQDPKELQDRQKLIRILTGDTECELKQLSKIHSTF